MSKIFDLKEWLTISYAAEYLGKLFGEAVSEADVLQLALEEKIRLSVYFVNHARARCGRVVSWEDTEWSLLPSLLSEEERRDTPDGSLIDEIEPPPKLEKLLNEAVPEKLKESTICMKSINIDGERFINLSNDVESISGVWDLPMIGAEKLDVSHMFQGLIDGPPVTLDCLSGVFVEEPSGTVCQVQESVEDNEYVSGSRAALEKLRQYIDENELEDAQVSYLLSSHREEREKLRESMSSQSPASRYYPAGSLPDDAVLVVRTSELRDFERRVASQDESSPPPKADRLDPRKEKSYLQIIQVMAEELGLPADEPFKAAEVLQRAADNRGFPFPKKLDTIAEKLKEASKLSE